MSFPLNIVGAVASKAKAAIGVLAGHEATLDQGNHIGEYSHLSGPQDGRRGLKEEEALKNDFEKYNQALADFESKIAHQNGAIRSLQSSLPDLQARNEETRKEIQIVNQDLNATRVHTSDEGTMQKEELVQEFVQLRAAVNSLVDMFQGYFNRFPTVQLTERQLKRLREYFLEKRGMEDAGKFVELTAGNTLQPIARQLLCHCMSFALMQHVFRPLLHGTKADDRDIRDLSQLLDTVLDRESQNCSGRWRALTYKHALQLYPQEQMWREDAAAGIMQEVSHLMGIVIDLQFTDEDFSLALQSTTQLIAAAAEFKDKAMSTCTDVNIEVYLPTSRRGFDPRFMEEAHDSTRGSKRTILGVGMGLALCHTFEKGSRIVHLCDYPVIASAVGDKSGLIQPGWFSRGG